METWMWFVVVAVVAVVLIGAFVAARRAQRKGEVLAVGASAPRSGDTK